MKKNKLFKKRRKPLALALLLPQISWGTNKKIKAEVKL